MEGMRFIADAMLGKLVKWLRLLGYDTLSANELPVDDDDLLNIAFEEDRILLTRDKELAEKAKKAGVKVYIVPDGDIEEQLAFLVKSAGIQLKYEPSTTICPRCNGPLVEVPKSEVKGKVPVTVYETRDRFWVCTQCGQIYWEGTHWKKMREVIAKVQALLDKGSPN